MAKHYTHTHNTHTHIKSLKVENYKCYFFFIWFSTIQSVLQFYRNKHSEKPAYVYDRSVSFTQPWRLWAHKSHDITKMAEQPSQTKHSKSMFMYCIDDCMQKRHNSIANARQLYLFALSDQHDIMYVQAWMRCRCAHLYRSKISLVNIDWTDIAKNLLEEYDNRYNFMNYIPPSNHI